MDKVLGCLCSLYYNYFLFNILPPRPPQLIDRPVTHQQNHINIYNNDNANCFTFLGGSPLIE